MPDCTLPDITGKAETPLHLQVGPHHLLIRAVAGTTFCMSYVVVSPAFNIADLKPTRFH